MCSLQILLYLFTFRLIALKQFNSLTTIECISWLGDREDTHLTGMREFRALFPALANIFMFDFVFCCCCVYTFCQNTFLSRRFAILSAMVSYFEYLTYMY